MVSNPSQGLEVRFLGGVGRRGIGPPGLFSPRYSRTMVVLDLPVDTVAGLPSSSRFNFVVVDDVALVTSGALTGSG